MLTRIFRNRRCLSGIYQAKYIRTQFDFHTFFLPANIDCNCHVPLILHSQWYLSKDRKQRIFYDWQVKPCRLKNKLKYRNDFVLQKLLPRKLWIEFLCIQPMVVHMLHEFLVRNGQEPSYRFWKAISMKRLSMKVKPAVKE